MREWEDELPTGIPMRELGSALTSYSGAADRDPQPFRPLQVPSVLGSPVAYVIVTSDALAPAFQTLADWKTQKGVPAVVRTTSFIRAQYPRPPTTPSASGCSCATPTRVGAKWVLLGGDTDIIPVRQAFTTFYGSEYIATDMYYSCVDGNWNADGDSLYGEGYLDASNPGDYADLLPELYVGRAPVLTLAEAQNFVAKTMHYERTPTAGYLDRSGRSSPRCLFAGLAAGRRRLDGRRRADRAPAAADRPAAGAARHAPLPEPHRSAVAAGLVPRDWQAVIDSIDAGYGLALHVGHGYRNVMEVGDASLTNSDAIGLANGDKLFNLYAINCTSNAIDFPCIGEAFTP